MKTFIVMPFDHKYDDIFSAIEEACRKVDATPIRADEIKEVGPIINQIFDGITNADCIIAEITEKNQNVYYEVGIAHCIGKPTILLAREGAAQNLPFDIRHNRVLFYDEAKLSVMEENLIEHLRYLKENITGRKTPLQVEKHLNNLSARKENSQLFLSEVVNEVAKRFDLVDPRLSDVKNIPTGIIVEVRDAFEERITALIDVNGIIKQMRRVSK